jgi:hypothetical protein
VEVAFVLEVIVTVIVSVPGFVVVASEVALSAGVVVTSNADIGAVEVAEFCVTGCSCRLLGSAPARQRIGRRKRMGIASALPARR